MSGTIIEGGNPLVGCVNVSGSKNSAIKLFHAALFSNEDIIISNVPKLKAVLDDIEIIESIGGKVQWVGQNSVVINGSQINSYEIPAVLGSKSRTTILLAGPLLFRFGRALLPKYKSENYRASPINRFIDTWRNLGVVVEEDDSSIKLTGENLASANIVFKTSSHMATDNAILSSVFIQGETVISNASEECEVDDLIGLLKAMGANVERTEPRKIKVVGGNIFKGAKFEVCPDKSEIATFAAAAILTKGNITLKGVNRDVIVQFINFLNKIGIRFEFQSGELKVWRNDEEVKPIQLEISPSPGFVSDWQAVATVILTQAKGESIVHDTVYVDRFGYVIDLNRMGAKIEMLSPSKVGLISVISDDSYDFEKMGEPLTVAKITGPSKLKGERLNIEDFRYGAVLVLSALCAEGKSEIIGIEHIEHYFENFVSKLKSLGAKIWEQ